MFACEFPRQELKSKQHTLNAEEKDLSFCSSGFALPLAVSSKTMLKKNGMRKRLQMVEEQRQHDTGSTGVRERHFGSSEIIPSFNNERRQREIKLYKTMDTTNVCVFSNGCKGKERVLIPG